MRRSVKLSIRRCDKKIGDIQWKRLSLRTKRPFRRAGTSFVSIHVKTRTKPGLIKELGQRQKAENSWSDVKLKTMFCILGAFLFIDISSPIGRFSETRNQNGTIGMLLIPGTGNGERGTGNGERGTGNGSLGTNVQRQPAWEFKMAVKTKEKARRETISVKVSFHRLCPRWPVRTCKSTVRLALG